MCNKRNTTKVNLFGQKKPRVDSCLTNLLSYLNAFDINTVASCCGHGKYNMSIVVKDSDGEYIDMISDIKIPRSTRFYKKDKKGYYYIPEVVKGVKP